MANEIKRKPDPRRVAMEQGRKRVKAARTNPDKQKKTRSSATPKKNLAKLLQKKPKSKKKQSPRKKPAFNMKDGFQVIVGGKKKQLFRLTAVVAGLLAVILAINIAVPITLGEYIANVFAGAGKGKGFPISVSTSEKSRLLLVGSDIALLGDSSWTLYKTNGKLLADRQHGFTNVAATACSSRMIVYDRGDTGVRVENRAKTLYTMEAKGPLTTAAIAENGYFALVTRSNNYVSEVTVYNHKAKEQYIWHSSSRQVTHAALSDNGRYLGVATLNVSGGEAVTDLLLFDTKKGTTLYELSCKGSTPVSVAMKKTTLMVLLSDRLVSVTKKGEKAEHLFDYGQPVCFDLHPAFGAVLSLSLYQDAAKQRVIALSPTLKVLGQADVAANVTAVSAKGSHITLLTDGQVLFYNRKGVLKKQKDLETDAKGILCKGDFAVTLSSDKLSKVK